MFVIGIGGYKVLNDELSIGFFTIINTYFSMMINSTSYFLSLAGSFQDNKVSINRIRKIMDADNEIYGNNELYTLDQIKICNLSVKYNDYVVFDNLNYEFEKGKIYAICGHNGAGKTTLLNSIIGLYSDAVLKL